MTPPKAVADGIADQLEQRPPYPGAEPALVVPPERREDRSWLHDLLTGSVAALRSRTKQTSR